MYLRTNRLENALPFKLNPRAALTFLVISLFALLTIKSVYAFNSRGADFTVWLDIIIGAGLAGLYFIGRRSLSEGDRQLQELQDKNRLLMMTEEHAHVGHWRVDFRTNELFWSDETFRIHGLPIGQPPPLEEAINLFHQEDRSIIQEAVDSARRLGRPYSFSARLVRPDGSIRFTQAKAQVELDADGNSIAIFGIFADRTAENELLESSVEARDRALEASQAKSSFLARTSHEIRTPLNGIVGFSDMLLDEKLSADHRNYVEMISESAKNLTQLLNDILDLSRIEAGRLELAEVEIDVPSLIGRCTQLARPQAMERGIKIDTSIAEDLPRNLAGDPLRIRQILNNLLANSIKFSPAGHIDLHAAFKDGSLIIKVRDEGIGISEDRLPKIFDAFTQADESITRKYGGTGLGLSISRHLARLMGGDLTATSDVGQGSTFTLEIPMPFTAVTAKRGSPKLTDDRSPSGLRVLLAEDYEINQILIEKMVTKLGHTIHVVENGSEAIDAVKEAIQHEQPFDLVLMDLQMPVLDGLQAALAIRELPIMESELPIIAISANAYEEDVEACKKHGMQSHLAKPLSFETLKQELTNVVGEERQAVAT